MLYSTDATCILRLNSPKAFDMAETKENKYAIHEAAREGRCKVLHYLC